MLSRWVGLLLPEASEELRLAARAHHIRRWQRPRSTFPEGRGGYLRWRTSLHAFHAEHERNYGYRREHEPVCIANLRLKAIAATANLDIRTLAADFGATREQRAALPRSTRPAFFGPGLGMQDAQIMNRDMLRGSVDGPAVFDEFDTTVVVPPGWRAVLDGFGNIVLTMTSELR